MQNIKIHKYESDRAKPEKIVTIPISKLDIAQQLIPTDVNTILKREGIDIKKIDDLSGKNIAKGQLIEIQTGKEKIIIEIE
jgi:hypothetical protein